MKTVASCLFACTLFAGTAALAATASAQQTTQPGMHAKASATDGSIAKRKHRTHRRATVVSPAYGPPVYSRWGGSDPSYGPGTAQMRAYQQRGECVLDEGYGRFSSCGER